MTKLQSGYAETSSRKYPKELETTIVGQHEIDNARHVGQVIREGKKWEVFKMPNRKRYYFQLSFA